MGGTGDLGKILFLRKGKQIFPLTAAKNLTV